MSTITTILATDSPSSTIGTLNTNFSNLNTDKIEATQTVALTNKTIDGELNTVTDLGVSALKTNAKTGLDTKVVTGTKGSMDELAKWNSDGDLVTAGVSVTTTAPSTSSLDTTIPTSQAVQESITAQMLTKEFFVPITAGNTLTSAYDTAVGDFATNTPDTNEKIYFVFDIPSNFNAFTSIKLVMIPDATETIQYDVDVDYASSGESSNVNSATISNQTESATSGVLLVGSDIKSALGNAQPGDYVGMRINSDTTQLRIIGLKCIYT